MTLIYRSDPAKWKDPWGVEHPAYEVQDVATVYKTDETVWWDNGYTVNQEPVFADEKGRRWARIPPMDFGGRTYYLDLGTPRTGLWYEHNKWLRLISKAGVPITTEAELRNLGGTPT